MRRGIRRRRNSQGDRAADTRGASGAARPIARRARADHAGGARLDRVCPAARVAPAPGVRTLRLDRGRPAPSRVGTLHTRWRRIGAIVVTLLHELAHVRYRSHGPRFWALHRRLVDRAVAAGVFDPSDRDPSERGRGDEKLAGSAARPIAMAARQARRERARSNRAALQAWQVGAVARISTGRGALDGAQVRVMGLGRTRLLVETTTTDKRRYRVAPALLVPAGASALRTT